MLRRLGDLAKHQGDLAELEAEFGHFGTVDKNVIALQEQPVVERHIPGVVFDLERKLVGPVERISVGKAIGDADHAFGPALVSVLAALGNAPDPLLRLAVVVEEVFDQRQGLAVPCAVDLDLELAAQPAETVLEDTPSLGAAGEVLLDQ